MRCHLFWLAAPACGRRPAVAVGGGPPPAHLPARPPASPCRPKQVYDCSRKLAQANAADADAYCTCGPLLGCGVYGKASKIETQAGRWYYATLFANQYASWPYTRQYVVTAQPIEPPQSPSPSPQPYLGARAVPLLAAGRGNPWGRMPTCRCCQILSCSLPMRLPMLLKPCPPIHVSLPAGDEVTSPVLVDAVPYLFGPETIAQGTYGVPRAIGEATVYKYNANTPIRKRIFAFYEAEATGRALLAKTCVLGALPNFNHVSGGRPSSSTAGAQQRGARGRSSPARACLSGDAAPAHAASPPPPCARTPCNAAPPPLPRRSWCGWWTAPTSC